MLALLTPRFWIGLALVGLLTFTHGFAYKSGRAAVRAQWDAEKAIQVADALVASEKRRNDEKTLNITNQGITNAYLKEKSRLVAARADADKRLLDYQAASDRAASERTASVAGIDDPYPAIASACATALVRMDEYAQGVAGKARALQAYTRDVCVIQ